MTKEGQFAQNTAKNRAFLSISKVIVMPETVMWNQLNAGLACDLWMAPDLADDGTPNTALPLNEIQASERSLVFDLYYFRLNYIKRIR